MGKSELQCKLIKTLAFSPWIYTVEMLADELGVSQCTIKRSLTEMETRGCIFTRDEQGRLYLQQTTQAL